MRAGNGLRSALAGAICLASIAVALFIQHPSIDLTALPGMAESQDARSVRAQPPAEMLITPRPGRSEPPRTGTPNSPSIRLVTLSPSAVESTVQPQVQVLSAPETGPGDAGELTLVAATATTLTVSWPARPAAAGADHFVVSRNGKVMLHTRGSSAQLPWPGGAGVVLVQVAAADSQGKLGTVRSLAVVPPPPAPVTPRTVTVTHSAPPDAPGTAGTSPRPCPTAPGKTGCRPGGSIAPQTVAASVIGLG